MLSSATDPSNYLSFNTAWQRLLAQLLTEGRVVAPRGQETREVIANRVVFDATRPVITVEERSLGYRFLCAEAAWIMEGSNRVADIAPYSKEISHFSDDGLTFFGAYGPMIHTQLEHVLHALVRDMSSRQAVISIWRPNPPDTKDVPCTVSLQWFRRDTQLHCVASMRSSDAWLGVPYDGFNFSMLTLGLLLELRKRSSDWRTVTLGTTTLLLGSSHLYERNYAGAQTCAFSKQYRVGRDGPQVVDHFLGELRSWETLNDHLWALARRNGGILQSPLLNELLEFNR